jgi:hypothetical protein
MNKRASTILRLSRDLLEAQYKKRLCMTGYSVQLDDNKKAKLVLYCTDFQKYVNQYKRNK